MDQQMLQLLEVVKAEDVRETEDHIYFKVGQRKVELYKGFPKVIQVETSSYCNLACLGCPQKDLTRKKGFMQPELFKKIVDELSNYPVRVWLHYMGEPLMHPQIFELVEYAGKKLPYCGMASNGILLSNENIEKVLDSKLFRFEISIDTLDPELARKYRPGSSLDGILANAHAYFKRKYERKQRLPITSINYRKLKGTQEETEEFTAYWKGILQEQDFILSFPYSSFGGHESLEHATYTVPSISQGEREACLRLWERANILSDGRLVTCDSMFDAQVVMGDLNTISIKEIWNSPEYFDRRQKQIERRYNELKVCDLCDLWYRDVALEEFKNLISETAWVMPEQIKSESQVPSPDV